MIIKTFGEYLLKTKKAKANIVTVDGKEANFYNTSNTKLKTIVESCYFKEEIKQIIFDKDAKVRECFLDLDATISDDESAGSCTISMDENCYEYYIIKLDAPIKLYKKSIKVEDEEGNIRTVAFFKRELTLVHPV
jgi:hypothetical protein